MRENENGRKRSERMKQKIGALALTAVMLLTLVCPAMAAEQAIFTVTGPTGAVKAGESFTVTVELKNNPGFSVLQFILTYDQDKLECASIKEGPLMEGTMSVNNPKSPEGAAVAAVTIEEKTGDGVVAEINFRAKDAEDSVSFGIQKVKLTGTDNTLIDYKLEGVTESSAPASSSGNTTPEVPVAPTNPTTPETPSTPSTPGVTDDLPTFPDTKGHWAETYIGQAAKAGLFKGYADGNFGPDDPVTRAQFVTVLYRMAGSPAVTATTPFVDIRDQIAEFQTAIAWAYDKGCVNGKSADTFDPAGQITRQEAMKILFFLAGGVSGGETMLTSIYDDTFTDSGEIASWAKQAMYWGVYQELISGTTATTLSPAGTATRAQLAKILVSYVDKTNA